MEEEVSAPEQTSAPEVSAAVEAPAVEVADTAPAPTGEVAAPTSAPETTESAAVEAPAETVEEAIAALTPDTFGWDDWKGESFDDFPEDVRAWAEKLYGVTNTRLDQERAALQELSDYYTQMLDTGGDPRVKRLESELETKLKELETFKGTSAEMETKYQEAVKRAEALENAWAKRTQEETDEQTAAFAEANAWLFDGKEDEKGEYVPGPKETEAVEIAREGWPHQMLPVIMRLPKGLKERAREYMKQYPGSSPELILKSIAKSVERPSSESDDMVSGSNGSKISAQTVTTALPQNSSPQERRLAVIRQNMARHRS